MRMKRDDRCGLSRVVLVYKEENFDAAMASFREALNIQDFDEPFLPPDLGLRCTVSWRTGIELIAPHGTDGYAAHMRAHLAEKGEGFFGLVYEVPDLEAGEARAAGAGYAALGQLDCLHANPSWKALFSKAVEAPLAPIAGVDVTLIQLDPVA
jgi:hypothetical protein